MTQSQAYKYSELFELLADPQSLMIMVILEENSDDSMSTEALASAVKTSTREAETHLRKFENAGIVTDESRDGLTYYKFTTSKNGRFIRSVIDRALEMYI